MPKILVTGSVAYDVLLQYPGSFAAAIDPAHLEELSMAFVTPHYARHHGGTGANIAWNLRLLQQQPLLVATVGRDGGDYLQILEGRGIGVGRIQTLAQHVTPTAIIASDNNARQITFYHPGADAHGGWPEDLTEEQAEIGFAIVSPRDTGVMLKACEWCEQFGVPYLFDPGQQVMAFGQEQLLRCIRGSRGVICNAYEWQLLSERTGFSTDDILQQTHMLIITNAQDGLSVYTPKENIVIPACKVETVVNPTGAGDALRAGILAGLTAKWDLRKCGQLGAAMAAFVVEHEGTLLDALDLEKVWARAEATYGEPLPSLDGSAKKRRAKAKAE